MATPHNGTDDELLAGIIEAAPDGIVIVDESGAIVLVNRQTEELFDYDRSDLLGKSVEILVPEQFRHLHVTHRTDYQLRPRTRPMGAGLSLRGRKRNGAEFPIEISISPLPPIGAEHAIAIIRDITERLEFERLLREAADNLQLLEDRERIARDLHDLVIQRLFAAGMALQAAIARLDDADVADRVSHVVDDLDDTISELRTVIFGLHDRRDRQSSVRSSVMQIVSEERAALGCEPRIRFDGPVDSIDDAIAEHLLAVLREGLSNVAHHAQATAVDIHLTADAQAVTLRIADDGIGVPDAPRAGNGLRNAADRAVALGGTFRLAPGTTGGTVFEWKVSSLG
jgi:two-component system sensor histidine kinase DevS